MTDKPRRLRRKTAAPFGPGWTVPDGGSGPVFGDREGAVAPAVRAVIRSILLLIWTLLGVSVQAILIALPGRPKIVFARWFWAVFSRVLGIRVRLIGKPSYRGDRRPVVFASGHSSWLDIAVLGATLDAAFISKDDVAEWPMVSLVARLGRTVFVSRQRSSTGRELAEISDRLTEGGNLVLFPEGTTSDGSRVLPFRSPFFAVADAGTPVVIQPVSVVYDRLDGLPIGRNSRPLLAWYGDMAIAPHYWQTARRARVRATVVLHPPLDPARFASRKALANASWRVVAAGSALLRQNRDPAASDVTHSTHAVG
ncbi:MAG: 1-acyl-sn-glycerol-3-phosphate acyltransferase [Acetobacteraceae bacterium]|nr:1-acyl-sn-glycerol-3-phosphate acyltransferase [Acetobacteraceae bacterium]